MARYENARAALSKAEKIATEKEQAIVWAQLGHLHREKGNHPRAELWYTRAVELCPTTQNLCFLGGALGSQGKLESAKRCFIEAIEVATDPPDEANLNLGLIYRTERDYVRAIECFEAALRIDPAYARALEALQSCRKALAASSSH